MHVVLVEPEIPYNTGNIVRTCASTGTELHLVGPLGFSMRDKYLIRAGLDYWELAKVHRHRSLEELWGQYPDSVFYYTSKKGSKFYTEVKYNPNDFLVFGKETEGLPESLLREKKDYVIRIPMVKEARCLNLSNAVAIVLYEALRQNNFNAGVQLV
ncbi:MAG: tRNA (uridine(34)/cytosine(34)/5-carboxymethylaminomethyluridine(34)-2'-O)-methyltransferase TrmL [Clostridia bacterium]|nr:tRNA (uridine(34)/cytosine(34)/5-carboxymethylaminomethyluridine(34)-2'-O)-methyltransferase TrmL [Clostridia bacterium]